MIQIIRQRTISTVCWQRWHKRFKAEWPSKFDIGSETSVTTISKTNFDSEVNITMLAVFFGKKFKILF